MRKSLIVAVAVLFSLGLAELFAETWSFEQIANEACATYPSVISKELSRDAAKEGVNSAEWQRFPMPGIVADSDKSGNSNFTMRLQQILWAGGKISSEINAAKSLHGASEKAIRETQFDIVLKIIDAYIEAVRQQARKTVGRNNVKQHERLDEVIKRRVAAEVSSEVDRKLSRSRLSQATNELSTIEQALAKSLTQLSQFSGKNVTGVAPINLETIGLPENKEAAIQQGIDWSPTLSRLAFEEAAAESQVKVKKAAYWPMMALRYEKTFNRNVDYNNTNTNDERFMVVLEAQPGAGLSAFSGVEAEIAKRKAIMEMRRSVTRELKQLISETWDGMAAARGRLENSSSALSSSVEVFESYQRQYIISRKSWLDVLNAVREATQSELYAEDVNAQVALSVLRISLLTGKLKLNFKD
jgi:adhesin transport system outer membrane protein